MLTITFYVGEPLRKAGFFRLAARFERKTADTLSSKKI